MLTRRHFLATSAAGAALAFAPRPIWAATTLTLGTMQIDTLSDGNLILPADFILAGMPPDDLAALMARHNLKAGELTPPCNVTLLRDGDRTVLFDVGAGPDFQPTAGKMMQAFDALGLTVEDVTHVVFTHGHPDHLWGLLDEFDEPMFPNAEHMMGQAEFDYWRNPETVNTIGDARTTFAAGAARRLAVIDETIRLLQDGEEILPGIAARLTPGHTPGHMSFEVRSGSESVMVVGDAIGNHHIAFDQPDWQTGSDQDAPRAAETRAALMDQLATDQMTLIGFHLPDGGIGRAERVGSGYRYTAEV
jgi:glyoxylase-like metal-dependent hydrolase (beta-lactamase superfamily II)